MNVLDILNGPTDVGWSDLLGRVPVILLLLAMICEVMAMSVMLRAKLDDNKRRREHENTYGQPDQNLVGALGVSGNANIQSCSGELKGMRVCRCVSEETANLVGRGTQKPRLSLRLISALGNLFRSLSHKCDVATRPNVES